MTFKIIDENTVEAYGVIGVFVEGGDCKNCILARRFLSHVVVLTALIRQEMAIIRAKNKSQTKAVPP